MIIGKNQKVKPEPQFARLVKSQLALRGMTQKDLAREIHAARGSVNRALKYGLNRGVLERIGKLLDIQQP